MKAKYSVTKLMKEGPSIDPISISPIRLGIFMKSKSFPAAKMQQRNIILNTTSSYDK
jgi:hypothetical protein